MNRVFLGKVTLSFVSLVVSLVLLEGGLRLAGAFIADPEGETYKPYEESQDYVRDSVYEKFGDITESRPVLAIGDSFTNAGNVKSYHSYPYFLFNLYSKAGRPRSVLNMGICENSTFDVKDRIKAFLKITPEKSLPEKMIILVGSADKYQRYNIDSDEGLELDWYHVNPPAFYNSLRIYKVYRFIKYSLLQKYLEGREKVEHGDYEQVKNVYLELKEKVKGGSFNFDPQEYLKKLPTGFKKYCERLHVKFEKPLEMVHSALIYMTKILSSKMRYDDSFFWLLDFAKDFPDQFWNGDFSDAYFRLVQIFQIQSKYDSAFVLEKLPNLSLVNTKLAKEFYILVTEKNAVAEYVDKKRFEAWSEIANITKEKNIEVFVLNYPSDYENANEIIEEAAKRNGLNFIDAHKFFEPIIREKGRENILEDDDHLTPEGYKLLAELVFKKIEGENGRL